MTPLGYIIVGLAFVFVCLPFWLAMLALYPAPTIIFFAYCAIRAASGRGFFGEP